jgi:hypothetical protein
MGENVLRRVARLLDRGVPVKKIRDVRGCVYLCKAGDTLHFDAVHCGEFDDIKQDGATYAKAFLKEASMMGLSAHCSDVIAYTTPKDHTANTNFIKSLIGFFRRYIR